MHSKSCKKIVTIVLCLYHIATFAQDKAVLRGTVSDEKTQEPLIQANITIIGTSVGAATDLNGKYTISKISPGKYTVSARYIGYLDATKTVNLNAGDTVEINFAMKEDILKMGEVVVTGQAAAIERRKIPTTVETVSPRDIEMAPLTSVDQLLQGRVPGLTSFSNSGTPGTGTRISTRGIKSVSLGSTPVIYVDGVRIDAGDNYALAIGLGGTVSSSLSDLVTGEIDHIEVIKGGAASTLYGSDAANGVIQIFTKRGIANQPTQWKVSIVSGFDEADKKFYYEDFTKKKIFQQGFYQEYGISTSGGNPTLTYSLSGKMFDNRGIIRWDKLYNKQYNFFGSIKSVLSEKTDVNFSTTYTRNQYGQSFMNNALANPLGVFETSKGLEQYSNPDSALQLILKLPELGEVSNRFINAINVNYSPIQSWNNKFTFGMDYKKNEQRVFIPVESGDILSTPQGRLTRFDREYMTTTLGYTSSYMVPEIGPFTQTLSVGVQGFRVEDRQIYANGNKFPVSGTKDFDNTAVVTAYERNIQLFSGGFFISDVIGVYDKMFLDFGVRFDGNSTYGKNIGIQTFPKVGIAYNISQEEFWKENFNPYWSNLKVRVAVGKTGNFPPPFVRDKQYVIIQYLRDAGIALGNPGNQNLKPEYTTSLDAGFDAGFLDDNVALTFSYFNQKTTGALFTVPSDPASGLFGQDKNIGTIENSGIELSMKTTIVFMDDFIMNVRASYATLNNKVTSLGGQPGFSIGGFAFAGTRVELNQPVGVFRVNRPIKEADGTYSGKYEERVFIGTSVPTQTGSFGLDFTIFQDVTMSIFSEFAFGHYILNTTLALRMNAQYADALEKLPKSTGTPYNYSSASSILVEKADWFKVREISLRYRVRNFFPTNVILFTSVRNLLTLTKATTDPEIVYVRSARSLEAGGTSGTTILPPHQYRFGVEVQL